MELKDEIRIKAPRDVVYAALNDPEVLKESIPGCKELVKHSDTDLEAKIQLKIGPVKATFGGNVTLDTTNAPSGFSLKGEGSGGPAGYAKGGADVELVEDGDETILRYAAKADIGGKIAQLGSRLIDSTAKRLSNQFFTKFSEQVAARQGEVAEGAADEESSAPSVAAEPASESDSTQPAREAQTASPKTEAATGGTKKFPVLAVVVAVIVLAGIAYYVTG
ncbi:CoxG family protein [Hwanghaeella sp.]|uniref:CoxG family protein n=1 Tax=Hwanghaeella sp. TaxID=2605943 RepID=UPI003CCBFE85